MQTSRWKRRPGYYASLVAAGILFAGLLGCGDNRPATYPVQGTVKFKDGEPVHVGIVEFRWKSTGEKSRGKLDPLGRFSLTTFGDRAVRCRVSIRWS